MDNGMLTQVVDPVFMTHTRTIYTIGYEGTDVSRFLKTLQIVGIGLLVDVRAVPISRKKGFSKRALQGILDESGIEYIHLAALGDPKEGRQAARAGRFAEFRHIYSEHITRPASQNALGSVAELAEGADVCLMCFERDPRHCHRTIVMENLKRYNFKQFDLFADFPERYVQHSHFLPGRNSGQGATAA
jgi:uncharacterized protein (DUF488 family)